MEKKRLKIITDFENSDAKDNMSIKGKYEMNSKATIDEIREHMPKESREYFDKIGIASGSDPKVHLIGTGKEYYITGNASGNFLTKEMPGDMTLERQENLQLPSENKAETVTKVKSTRPQVVIESRIKPQEQFAKEAGYKAKEGIVQVYTPNTNPKGAIADNRYEIGETIVDDTVVSENHNGYKYSVYNNGTTVAEGNLRIEKAKRNSYIQRKAGGDARLPDDHGGHLVPASAGGTSDEINLTAQNNKVNTRDIRAVERAETSSLKKGNSIYTERTAYFGSNPDRPDAYMITDTITSTDGNTQKVYYSISNIDENSFVDQNQEYNDYADRPDSYVTSEAGKYMGKDEYNSVLDENEGYLPTVNDMYDDNWTYKSFDTEQPTAEQDEEESEDSEISADEEQDEVESEDNEISADEEQDEVESEDNEISADEEQDEVESEDNEISVAEEQDEVESEDSELSSNEKQDEEKSEDSGSKKNIDDEDVLEQNKEDEMINSSYPEDDDVLMQNNETKTENSNIASDDEVLNQNNNENKQENITSGNLESADYPDNDSSLESSGNSEEYGIE